MEGTGVLGAGIVGAGTVDDGAEGTAVVGAGSMGEMGATVPVAAEISSLFVPSVTGSTSDPIGFITASVSSSFSSEANSIDVLLDADSFTAFDQRTLVIPLDWLHSQSCQRQ